MLKIKLTFLLSFVLLLSCDGDDSDNFDDPYGPGGYSCGEALTNFRILGLNSSNLNTTNVTSNAEELDTINYNNFSIRFRFEREYFNQLEAKNATLKSQSSSSLTCLSSGFEGDIIGVDTLYIRTKFDYNTFIAGDTINTLVRVRRSSEFENNLEDYITENEEGVLFDSFELRLSEEPLLSNTSFALDVSYILNNGEEFNTTTETIILE